MNIPYGSSILSTYKCLDVYKNDIDNEMHAWF